MTIYFVDDGGSATAPYDTWAKAATSLSALDDAVSFASGDIVYIGHDHVCAFVHAADRTITGPTSGLPTYIISATQGSNPPAYQKSTTNQIDTTEGAYILIWDGAFALYGVRIKSGSHVRTLTDSDEVFFSQDCTFALGANAYVHLQGSFGATKCFHRNLTIDLTADGETTRTAAAINHEIGRHHISGLSFANAGYRTGTIISAANSAGNRELTIEGADFSGFTQAGCEIVNPDGFGSMTLTNCVTVSSPTVFSGASRRGGGPYMLTNYGTADAPSALYLREGEGDCVSSALIYRTGGAAVEGDATSWLITTTASCSEGSPFYTPWIYDTVNTTGAKTFDCYITNDTADFDDSQVWLEVEYLATADDAKWTLATDQRATITTTAAAQTDDTTSAWNGAGPAFTYKQKLSVTANVGETGQYRARVAVGVASIASSRYFYVDPKVTVT